MAQAAELRSSTSPNIQDVFLNSARRDRLSVTISLLDGRVVEGRIKHFDRYALPLVPVAGVLAGRGAGAAPPPRGRRRTRPRASGRWTWP